MTRTDQRQVDLNHAHDLSERTKELKCLYGTFKLFNMMDVPWEKVLQEVVDLIPSGWQFSEIACARLMIGDMEYRSERYMQSKWILTTTIVANKEQLGIVEIAYSEKRQDCFKGPFLEEEVFCTCSRGRFPGVIIDRSMRGREAVL